MKHREQSTMTAFFPLLLSALVGISDSGDRNPESVFTRDDTVLTRFESRQYGQLLEEYRRLTGDTSKVDVSRLLSWRRSCRDWTNRADFEAIRQEYLSRNPEEQSSSPCEIMVWHNQRVTSLEAFDDTLSISQTARNIAEIDSLYIAHQLSAGDTSVFDQFGIPFGVNRRAFHMLCADTAPEIRMRKSYSYLDRFYIDGHRFLIAFHFTDSDRYHQYEFQGRFMPADSLDESVRSEARVLQEYLSRRAGPPDHIFRVGYFDIKPNNLTPSAAWKRKDGQAVVGFSQHEGRYYAKARIIGYQNSNNHSQHAISSTQVHDSTETAGPKPR